MIMLEILGGWLLLSCVAAPLIGRFIAVNATVVEHEPAMVRPALQPGLQPAQSF
ncbi:MAG TPA: hypothetical protein VHV26_13075 [Rhizomicrobium sp.]|jgi:hypothetical protein|nr:hypothetical protein [Rhizomicrobium sp.]